MPKSSNHLALARQWEMLKLLPHRAPGITSRELCMRLGEAGYAVSKRTVERDLNDLSLQFGIACDDTTKPFGWHWLPGQQQNFESVELAEAVSLTLAEDVLKQMLPPSLLQGLQAKFAQSRGLLSAISTHPLTRLREKVRFVPSTLSFQTAPVSTELMETVYEALLHEQVIKAVYASFHSKPKERELHPLGLVQRGNVLYLLASSSVSDDVHLYAMHRFESIVAIDKPFKAPEDFSLDRCIAEGIMDFGEGGAIELKARLSEELATCLAETAISADQKLSFKDGGWRLVATIRDSWQLHFWILSQGSGIEILEPKTLRDRCIQEIGKALANYSKSVAEK